MSKSAQIKEFFTINTRELAKFTSISSGKNGITRLAYTPEESRAFEFAKRLMESNGLRTETDPYGNLYGSIGPKGTKKVMSGSHLDSVANGNGGPYDGVVGTLAAIKALNLILESGAELKNEVVAAGFRGEESARFGKAYVGSSGAFGLLGEKDLARIELDDVGYEKITLLEAMKSCGFRPEGACLKPKGIRAFIEVHIEQGPVLERLGKQIGIVTGIAGNERFRVRLKGEGQHTGASQMKDRKDAAFAMADIIRDAETVAKILNKNKTLVEEFFQDIRIAASVISQQNANLTTTAEDIAVAFDFRSMREKLLEKSVEMFKNCVNDICRMRGIGYAFEKISSEKPVEFPRIVQFGIARAAEKIGLHYRSGDFIAMPSGAGHDAKNFHNQGIDTGMIFIRSRNGSHNPNEGIYIEDTIAATEVLAETLVDLAS